MYKATLRPSPSAASSTSTENFMPRCIQPTHEPTNPTANRRMSQPIQQPTDASANRPNASANRPKTDPTHQPTDPTHQPADPTLGSSLPRALGPRCRGGSSWGRAVAHGAVGDNRTLLVNGKTPIFVLSRVKCTAMACCTLHRCAAMGPAAGEAATREGGAESSKRRAPAPPRSRWARRA
jgi:hypothetical protein